MIGPVGPLSPRRDKADYPRQTKPRTARRILGYVSQYRWMILLLLLLGSADSAITVANPLILRLIIDRGILPRHVSVSLELSVLMAGLGILDACIMYLQTLFTARVCQNLIYNVRTRLFDHVQRQPIAFFTQAQTGSLVSRLNTDIISAQQAITSLLSQTLASVLTLTLVLAAMFYLSWQISLVALPLIPLFIFPGKVIGKKLRRFTRQVMQLDAEMASMTSERFNIAGAILTKLYGRPGEESRLFAASATRVRDTAIRATVYGRMLFIFITVLAALATALVYAVGGALVTDHVIQIGTLVAMIALLTRLYGPVNLLSNAQVNIATATVVFERVFELLDLKPAAEERPRAFALPNYRTINGRTPEIEFSNVFFSYPRVCDTSLSSLDSVTLFGSNDSEPSWALNDISFHVPAGRVTALVGPSGAGKTTVTHLLSRLYDPHSGSVKIGGYDIRDLTLLSLRDTVGVVTQDPHLFHDTIRTNLIYARPDAAERELIEACKTAQVWDLISCLPDGLDTVVGDRGYRLSGGEKQRITMARLLLKAPPVVVLDEATAHLDSESEAAIQLALRDVLADRTSLVIAHRLSTVRNADQILVLQDGRVTERGTHVELLRLGGLYRKLYRTQFAER